MATRCTLTLPCRVARFGPILGYRRLHVTSRTCTLPGMGEGRTEPNDYEPRLVEALKDRIEYLQEQLAEEREARRRADRLLARLIEANAGMAEQIRELTARKRPPGDLGTGAEASEEAQNPGPRSDAVWPQVGPREPVGAEQEDSDSPRRPFLLPWLGG